MQLPQKASEELQKYYKVSEISPDEEKIKDVLGIQEIRYKELRLIAELAYKTNTSFTRTVSEVSEFVKHQNEFTMVMIILCSLHMKSIMPFPSLSSLFSSNDED